MEQREDSAEEGCGVPAITSYNSGEESCARHRQSLPTEVLVQVPFLQSPGAWARSTATCDTSRPNSRLLSSRMFQREHPIGGAIH